MEPLLIQLLAPLGDKGIEITEQVVGFVENMNVGVLGALGLAMLFLTVVSLMQKIERAFNSSWRITQLRSLAHRVSSYLTVIVIGPVLVFSAVGITASLVAAPVVSEFTAIEPVGKLFNQAARVVPFALIVSAFTFLYIFMPNTRVRFGPALAGGLSAGILWQVVGWVFASFIVTSSQYTAVYSAFATLILFLIWLYLGWLILLLGASISFYVQNPRYIGGGYGPPLLSARQREVAVLMIIREIGRGFYRLRPAASAQSLAETLQLPLDTVEETLGILEQSAAVTRSSDAPPIFLPARAPEETPVAQVLEGVRRNGEKSTGALRIGPSASAIAPTLERLDAAIEDAFEGVSVKDLAQSPEPSDAIDDAVPTPLRDGSRRARVAD
jgi:membrane protein